MSRYLHINTYQTDLQQKRTVGENTISYPFNTWIQLVQALSAPYYLSTTSVTAYEPWDRGQEVHNYHHRVEPGRSGADRRSYTKGRQFMVDHRSPTRSGITGQFEQISSSNSEAISPYHLKQYQAIKNQIYTLDLPEAWLVKPIHVGKTIESTPSPNSP